MGEDVLVPIAGMMMIISLALGIPIVRGLVKRWERESQTPRVPSDVSQRLERIERAIDAMAVEVERISEGQRFTTKLLSARAAAPNVVPNVVPNVAPNAEANADAARPNQFAGESR